MGGIQKIYLGRIASTNFQPQELSNNIQSANFYKASLPLPSR
jgi:hypothetical protein